MEQRDIEAVIDAIAQRLGMAAKAAKRAFSLSMFTFNIEYLPATLNAFTNGSFIVQNDSAFVCVKGTYVATLTDNQTPVTAVTVPAPAATIVTSFVNAPFLVNIVDSGSGRQFSNIDTHIDNWFGTAQRPALWAAPQVFDPNSNVTMRVQNLNASISYNVRAAFHGYKVFGDVERFKMRKAI